MQLTNPYLGDMTRIQGLTRLASLGRRLGVRPSMVKVRPQGQSGMSLSFPVGPVEIVRQCSSQADRNRNFLCLVFWMGDLVRNVERGIETLAEATWAEGGYQLSAVSGGKPYLKIRPNLYRGKRAIDQSLKVIERCLKRLGRTHDDLHVSWDDQIGAAHLRLRLETGVIVDKKSERQVDARSNVAALALWLQSRCRNFERGIERDLERLFIANLLPQGVRS